MSATKAEESYSDSIFLDQLNPDNKQNLSLVYQGNPIANIDSYVGIDSTIVSVKQLFEILGYEYKYDPVSKRIFGHDRQARWFMIRSISQVLSIETEEISFGSHEVAATEDDIFAEITFLSKYFGFDLSYNLNKEEISITTDTPLFQEKNEPPHISSAEPIKQDNTITVEKSKIIPPDAALSSSIENPAAPPEEAHINQEIVFPPNSIEVNEDNFLSFEVAVSNLVHEELVDVYKEGDFYFTPIEQLAEAIAFPIKFNPVSGFVEGWFINEKNTFKLDVPNGAVTIAGEEISFDKNAVFIYDDAHYILVDLINKWMPVGIIPDYKKQALILKPNAPLPFQAKRDREKKKEEWEREKKRRAEKEFEVLEHDYGYTDWPAADFAMNLNYNKSQSGEKELTPSFSTILAGDAKWLNVKAFANADHRMLTNLRVTGKRNDLEGDIFGHISKLEVGDVSSVDTALIDNSDQGRGILISSFPINKPSQFDSTILEGDSLPGWDIELYSNSTLVDFQTVGDDGRYRFIDVPIFYGTNDIKLVFYGPQGEIREETTNLLISSSVIKKGDFFYSASATESNKPLFKVGAIDSVEGRSRFKTRAEYGLTDTITLSSSLAHITLDDSEEEHTYQSLGLSTAIGKWLTNVNFAQDYSHGGWAAELSANTRLFDVNFQAKQEVFSHDYVNDQNESDVDPAQSISTVTLSGSVDAPVVSNVGYRLKTEHERRLSRQHVTDIQGRLSTSYRGISYSNSTNINTIRTDETTNTTIGGSLSARGRVDETLIRANAQYDIEPITQLQNIDISAQRKLSKDLNTTVSMSKNFLGDRSVSLSGLLNWKHDKFTLSNSATLNTNSSFSVATNVSFSLFENPRSSNWALQNTSTTGSGAISTIAFLDSNYNNIFDDGEEVLEEVTFLKSNIKKKSDSSGEALLTGISDGSYTNISIDENSLDDAMLVPSVKGYSVIGHAGVTRQINMAVVETSEIDGIVYFVDDAGKEQTISGVTLFLLTPEGKKIAHTKTEFDGLFIFSRVLPGRYFVMVSDEELKMLGVRAVDNTQVAVEMGGDIYSGYDIILSKAPPAPVLPPVENQIEAAPEAPVQIAETPWPENKVEEPSLKMAEIIETPIPEYANIKKGSLEDIATTTALLPNAMSFQPDIYGLPESRYSYYQLGINPHLKRKSLEEFDNRLAARKDQMDLYSMPISRFSSDMSSAIASFNNTYHLPHTMDQKDLEERFGQIEDNPRHAWIKKLADIEKIIGNSAPLIGLNSSSSIRYEATYLANLPKRTNILSPLIDIEERIAAQQQWLGIEGLESLHYRKSAIPIYSLPTEDEINAAIAARMEMSSIWGKNDNIKPAIYRESIQETAIASPTHSTLNSKNSRLEIMIPNEYLQYRKRVENPTDEEHSAYSNVKRVSKSTLTPASVIRTSGENTSSPIKRYSITHKDDDNNMVKKITAGEAEYDHLYGYIDARKKAIGDYINYEE